MTRRYATHIDVRAVKIKALQRGGVLAPACRASENRNLRNPAKPPCGSHVLARPPRYLRTRRETSCAV